MRLLPTAQWHARAEAHRERTHRFTAPWRARRARQTTHPVYDFLFQYYHFSPGRLDAWHPNADEAVEDSDEARAAFKSPIYVVTDGAVHRTHQALSASEREKLAQIVSKLRAVHERPANFGCYGMHEWAMVYGGHDVRHAEIAPLRLSQPDADAFVESRPIACTHFDAVRFFAPAAVPLNRIAVTWDDRRETEQPGCIHANMDLYRWAYTCMPWIGSDLLWECFALAVEFRELDMRAGPYDLRGIGFEPLRVETPEGRDEYQRQQRALSARAQELRQTLIASVTAIR